jgi:predicted transcriptional regulator
MPGVSPVHESHREIALSPEVQAKLARIAHDPGTNVQALAREAIERLVDYDDWLLREIEKGLAQIDRGETLSHEAVGARLERQLTETPPG